MENILVKNESEMSEGLNQQILKLDEEVWKNTKVWEINYTKIIKISDEALKHDPNNIITLTNLGAALSNSSSHEKAIKVLQKAINLGSIDRHTYFNMGVACVNTQKEHMSFFKKAGKLKNSDYTFEAYFDPQAY